MILMTSLIATFVLGMTRTSVMEEKQFNPRLTKTKEEFIKIMDNLNLPYPKKIGKFMTQDSLFFIRNTFEIQNHMINLWRV